MAGKTNPREWGALREQTTKSARYQASYVGPDLRRHFAPITVESKMIAERRPENERDRIKKAAANNEGLPSWKPLETISGGNKAKVPSRDVAVADALSAPQTEALTAQTGAESA